MRLKQRELRRPRCRWWVGAGHVWRMVKDHGEPGPGVQGNHWVTYQCAFCGKEKARIIGTTLTGLK